MFERVTNEKIEQVFAEEETFTAGVQYSDEHEERRLETDTFFTPEPDATAEFMDNLAGGQRNGQSMLKYLQSLGSGFVEAIVQQFSTIDSQMPTLYSSGLLGR